MKKIITLLMALLLCLSLFACSEPEPVQEPVYYPVDPSTSYTVSLPRATERTNFVQFTMEGGATFVVELYPDIAPITVDNFQDLVENEFYNGLTFHRVYKGFMIQGGDPNGNGTGSSPNKILGEFNGNPDFEGDNDLSHTRGVLSMARQSNPYYNSASCQFFIMHANNTRLDGQYAAFGRVVAGMETVDTIANVKVRAQSNGETSKPVERITIVSAYFVNYQG